MNSGRAACVSVATKVLRKRRGVLENILIVCCGRWCLSGGGSADKRESVYEVMQADGRKHR